MTKYLVSLLFILSCGMPNPGGVHKASKYENNTELWLDNAQQFFKHQYNWEPERPIKEFVVFYFYESQADVNTLCKSTENVAGCIYSYWTLVILDTPDDSIRCQAVLHEAAHIMIAQKSYKKTGVTDWQYDHSDPAFKDLVFDERNCK